MLSQTEEEEEITTTEEEYRVCEKEREREREIARMIVVLSPAKTLSSAPPPAHLARIFSRQQQQPRLIAKAHNLTSMVSKMSRAKLKGLLNVSDALADLNYERYRSFMDQPASPSIMAFDGQAFKGLDARSLKAEDMVECESCLRVLSGVYGLLRPFDCVRPYRLEMGTKMHALFADKSLVGEKEGVAHMKTLYDYWETDVAKLLNDDLDTVARDGDDVGGERIIVNCASAEYWKVVDVNELSKSGTKVVTINFRGATVHVKEARGAMARYIIQHKPNLPSELQAFSGTNGEWTYVGGESDGSTLVFVRSDAKAKKNAPAAAKKRTSVAPVTAVSTKRKKRASTSS